MLWWIILTMILSSANGYPKWLEENGIADQVVLCVENIAKTFFTSRKNFVLISDGGFLASRALREWEPNFAVMVADKESMNDVGGQLFREEIYFVVFDDDLMNLHMAFRNTAVNRRGRYVVVTTKDEGLTERVSSALWNERFADVIFLKPETNGTIIVQGYDILSQHSNTTGLYVLERCNNGFRKKTNLFPLKMSNMKGYPLKVTAMSGRDTEHDVHKTLDNGVIKFRGFAADIINRFSDQFKFSLAIIEEPSEVSEYLLANGSWNGIVGQVIRREADIGFTRITPSIMLRKQIDFSFIYRWKGFRLGMKASGREVSWRSVFMPLSVGMWTCIFFVLVAYIILLRVIGKLHDMGLMREYIKIGNVFRVILSQNVTYPTKTALRITLGMWLIYAYFITNAYTGSLVEILTKPKYEGTIETLQELRDSGKAFVGPIGSKVIFNDTTDPLLYDLYKRYISLTPDEISSAMCNGMVSMVPEVPILIENAENIEHPSRKIHLSKEKIISYPEMFYLAKGHPYLELLNSFILRLQGSGLTEKWRVDYNIIETEKIRKDQGPVVLTSTHLGGVFLLLLFGYFISTVVFSLEFYRGNVRRN